VQHGVGDVVDRGAGSVKLRGVGLLLLALLRLLLLLFSSCGDGGKAAGASRVWGRSGLGFIGGARVRGRLRPRVLSGRAGTRGAIAVAAAWG
jgi:hypothetical protein